MEKTAKPKQKRERRAPEHYVNNKEFSAAVHEYVEEVQKNPENPPQIPRYIGESFMKISYGLAHKRNFIDYSYRDEMIADGIEDCVKRIMNYNIEAATRSGSPNAFSYFTQICFFAFLRRIKKEKKQQTLREKLIDESDLSLFMEDGDSNILNGVQVKNDNYYA